MSANAMEFFARGVDPRRWYEVRILMLISCFDASGKTPSSDLPNRKRQKRARKTAPDSPVMAVCGFASQAGIWAEFDILWSRVLKHYRVPYFHAGDFAYSNFPFNEGWKDEEQKRRDFLSELMEAIKFCGLRKFGSLLWVADQQKAKAALKLTTDATASPYVLCSRGVAEDFIAYAIGEGQRENVKYIFERGDEESRLREHFEKHFFPAPHFSWSKPVERKGIIQKPFLGLQAAGWLVWEYYLTLYRLSSKIFKHDPEGRWALRIFADHNQVPGNVKILYKSSMTQDYSKQLQEALTTSTKDFATGLERIERARAEGAKTRAE